VKIKLLSYFLIILFLAKTKAVLSQTIESPCRLPDRFVTSLELNCANAGLIAGKIISAVSLTQDNITRIADSKYPYERKTGSTGLIENTIASVFQSKNSIIQVTSIGKAPVSRYIEDYLNLLADLSGKNIYNEVKITFLKDFTKLIDIEKLNKDTYLFNIETWQVFNGCINDGNSCYSDVTKKVFIAKLTNKTSDPTIRIEQISATDTYSYDQFKKLEGSILGGFK
jgi:hypothetical protein